MSAVAELCEGAGYGVAFAWLTATVLLGFAEAAARLALNPLDWPVRLDILEAFQSPR